MFIDMRDKNILVTGGIGLIGKQLCWNLVDNYANLFFVDINTKKISSLEKNLLMKYPLDTQRIVGRRIDLSQEKQIKEISKIIDKDFYGELHGIVNCVQYKPVSFFNEMEKYTLGDWEKIFSVNVFSIFLLFKYLLPFLKKAGGASIVNLSSTYAIVSPNPIIYNSTDMGCPAAYVASKGAVSSLTRYLACYYAKDKIRVNSVTPHGVFNNHQKNFIENFSRLSPLGRMSKPDEVCPVILFLLSDESSYVTGANYCVDGGWTSW